MTTDYQKICTQLQIQRNQFADAHATAAARAETLAEELDRVNCEHMADRKEFEDKLAQLEALIEHLRMSIADHRAKIYALENPQLEMMPVTRDEHGDDCPF